LRDVNDIIFLSAHLDLLGTICGAPSPWDGIGPEIPFFKAGAP